MSLIPANEGCSAAYPGALDQAIAAKADTDDICR